MAVELGETRLPGFLDVLLPLVHRELADGGRAAGEQLHTLAQEVADLLRSVAGREAFAAAYARVVQATAATRDKRRRQAALQVRAPLGREGVTSPCS